MTEEWRQGNNSGEILIYQFRMIAKTTQKDLKAKNSPALEGMEEDEWKQLEQTPFHFT